MQDIAGEGWGRVKEILDVVSQLKQLTWVIKNSHSWKNWKVKEGKYIIKW